MDAGALLVGDVVAQPEQVVPELPVDAQQAVLGGGGTPVRIKAGPPFKTLAPAKTVAL